MKARFIVIFVLILTTQLFSQVDENIVWESKTIFHNNFDISPNDSLIAITFSGLPPISNEISIFDLKTGEMLKTLNRNDLVKTVSFSYDGKYLASAGAGGYFYIWNVNDWSIFKGVIISDSGFEIDIIETIQFSNNGYLVAIGGWSSDGVLIYDMEKDTFTNNIYYYEKEDEIATFEVLFSPNDDYVAISNSNNPIRIISLDNDSTVFEFETIHDRSICFSPDSKYFAIEMYDYIQLYSTNTFEPFDIIAQTNLNQVHDFNFSKNGKYLIKSMPTEIWDVENKSKIKSIPIDGNYLKFTSDNKYIVISGSRLFLYKSGLETTSIREQSETLLEYYPNPSSNSLTINLELGHDQNIMLSITDILGNEPLILEKGFLQYGKYNFNFDISGLPVGIYFLRLLTDKDFIMRKLVVGR